MHHFVRFTLVKKKILFNINAIFKEKRKKKETNVIESSFAHPFFSDFAE